MTVAEPRAQFGHENVTFDVPEGNYDTEKTYCTVCDEDRPAFQGREATGVVGRVVVRRFRTSRPRASGRLEQIGQCYYPIQHSLPDMIQFGWVLAAVYVGLAAGLFYALAIGVTNLFFLLAALLIVLAIPQWVLLSRRRGRSPDGTTTSGD